MRYDDERVFSEEDLKVEIEVDREKVRELLLNQRRLVGEGM